VASRYTAHVVPQRPLTAAQERALVALVEVCGKLGSECETPSIADEAGMRAGGVTLAMRGLELRRMVIGHGEDPRVWAPTLTGRALARTLRGEPPASSEASSAAPSGGSASD
jgi:hypothetical protein